MTKDRQNNREEMGPAPLSGGVSRREHLQTAIRLAGATLSGQDRDLRYTWIENPVPQFGSAQVVGRSDEDVLSPSTAAVVVPVKRAVIDSGKAQRVEYREEIGGEPQWFDLRIEPEFEADGTVTGLTCACIEVTERGRWEEHQRILLLELAHRSKNLLAVVQSLANQTGKGTASMEEFKRRFFGRLYSLSRAHEILSDYNWRGAGLRELIRSQVLMYVGDAGERIRYEGPPVYLRPNAAQHVGLALHELTTNALKHGALRGAGGEVEISWMLSEPAECGAPSGLMLQWSETQDEPIALPPVRSFGRILLESVVPTSVAGESWLEMGPYGILYRLQIRSDELVERPGVQAMSPGHIPSVTARPLAPCLTEPFTKPRVAEIADRASPTSTGGSSMNWDRIKGNWREFKGKAKQQWGKLTDDDLDVIDGKREELAGKIQNRYGIAKDEAERQIDEWETRE